jgi:CheY-like chemotaxis protein
MHQRIPSSELTLDEVHLALRFVDVEWLYASFLSAMNIARPTLHPGNVLGDDPARHFTNGTERDGFARAGEPMSETISFVLDELVSKFCCRSAAIFREDASGRVQISAAGDPAKPREESVVTTAGAVRVTVEFGFTPGATERQRLDARAVAQTIAYGYAEHLGASTAPQTTVDGRILVVDYDANKQKYLRDVLETKGFRMLEAPDTPIGHARALEFAPDLIILNAIMPRLDGYEVAARLRSDPITASIPILMLMRHSQSDGPIIALSYGIVDILFDPFEPHELVRSVVKCLGRTPSNRDTSIFAPRPYDHDHVVPLTVSAASQAD